MVDKQFYRESKPLVMYRCVYRLKPFLNLSSAIAADVSICCYRAHLRDSREPLASASEQQVGVQNSHRDRLPLASPGEYREHYWFAHRSLFI